jgi:DNA-binding transcriptional regulator YhcF (GntR family)
MPVYGLSKVKFEVVADGICKRVLTGRFEPGKRIPSEKDLAGDFGVSVQTVNKAISVLVSQGILVRRGPQGAYVAEGLDLERLRGTRAFSVGIVYDASVHTIADSDRVLGRLTFNLQQLLGRASFAWTLISRTEGPPFAQVADSLDAVVTVGDVEPAVVAEIAARRLACVTFNRDFRQPGLVPVLIGTRAIADLVDHLAAGGYRRLLFVANDAPRQVYAIRKAAFAQAAVKRGLGVSELILEDAHMKGERLSGRPLRAVRDSDAAFLPNDQLAILFLRLLERTGLRVPGDLAVAGHDDTLAGRHCSVPLTTIAYDLAEAAAAVVRTLDDALHRRPQAAPAVIDSRLVPRASTAARAAGGAA